MQGMNPAPRRQVPAKTTRDRSPNAGVLDGASLACLRTLVSLRFCEEAQAMLRRWPSRQRAPGCRRAAAEQPGSLAVLRVAAPRIAGPLSPRGAALPQPPA